MMAVGAAAGAVAVGMFAKVGKEALLMANDAVESEQLFEVSMDKMESKARSWSDTLSKSLGLNAIEVRKNVGTMNVMLLSMGMTEDAAYDMSTGLTELASDMASFYNIDTQDAMGKLQSGITGMGMPLKQLGILVDEEIIKEYAMRKGISKTGKELTQQQKVLARYGAIMEQTTKAQGDLARTMESPTNQIRQLNAQLDAAKIALGTALQPALIAILPSLTKLAVGAGNVLNAMNAAGKQTRSAFGDVGLSVQEASDAIKGAIMGKTESLVAEILAAKDAVNDAIDGYGEAATETKKVLLLMELEPKTTGYFRIGKKLESIKELLDISLKGGIASDLTAYLDMMYAEGKLNEEQLLERKAQMNAKVQKLLDDASEFELKIKGMVDLALADGVVTPKEMADIAAEIDKGAEGLVSETLKYQAEIGVQIEADLLANNISPEYAESLMVSISKSTKDALGVIDGIVVDLKLEVGATDWTTPSISPAQKQVIADLITAELAKGDALKTSAAAEVTPLWSDMGDLGAAVFSMFDAANVAADEAGANLNKYINDALKVGGTINFKTLSDLRTAYYDALKYVTGDSPMARLDQALFDAKSFSDESIDNVTKAYTEGVEKQKTDANSFAQSQKDFLFNRKQMPGFDDWLSEEGYTLESAIAEIDKVRDESIASTSSNAAKALAESWLPTIQDIVANGGDPSKAMEGVAEILKSIDIGGLDEAGKQAALSLIDAFDLSGMGTVFEEQLLGLREIIEPGGVKLEPELPKKPKEDTEVSGYVNPTEYVDDMTQHLTESIGGAVIEAFSNLIPIVDAPTNKNQDPFGAFGGGGVPQVTITSQPINVSVMMDKSVFGKAAVEAIQTVTVSAGGTVPINYGGR